MGSFGLGGSKSKSKNKVKFNTSYLDEFAARYGDAPMVRSDQLPKPESAFTPRVEAQARGLGIGRAPETIQGPAAVSTTNIQAPTVGPAARVEIPGGSREAYQNSLFNAQFNPIARQFDRNAAMQRRELAGNVAGAGLQGSGAGIGLIQQQAQQQSEDRAGLASDAANRATAASFGFEQQAALSNAERAQQSNLAQAGFDMQAQAQNAANVLQGNLANASNYLATIGMNVQQAQQARDSFMNLLGLRMEDTARLGNEQRANLDMLFNQWLQTFGAARSAANTTGKQSGFNWGVSGEI